MLRIKQARLSRSVSGFDFPGAYGLEEYTSRDEPCVFFGCYAHTPNPIDYRALRYHTGLAIIVWCGSDALLIPRGHLQKIKKMKNVRHVAIGGFIAKDLDRVGIKYARLPLTPTQPKPNPQPLGRFIYCYLPDGNKAQRNFYGGNLIDELKRILPEEKFITTRPRQFNSNQMEELYKKSYMGLRLTRHDGLSNTVMELGAMGRMCVYNDNVPNAIPWRGIDDIVSAIRREKTFRDQTRVDIANAIGNFLDVPDDWLYTNFWK